MHLAVVRRRAGEPRPFAADDRHTDAKTAAAFIAPTTVLSSNDPADAARKAPCATGCGKTSELLCANVQCFQRGQLTGPAVPVQLAEPLEGLAARMMRQPNSTRGQPSMDEMSPPPPTPAASGEEQIIKGWLNSIGLGMYNRCLKEEGWDCVEVARPTCRACISRSALPHGKCHPLGPRGAPCYGPVQRLLRECRALFDGKTLPPSTPHLPSHTLLPHLVSYVCMISLF